MATQSRRHLKRLPLTAATSGGYLHHSGGCRVDHRLLQWSGIHKSDEAQGARNWISSPALRFPTSWTTPAIVQLHFGPRPWIPRRSRTISAGGAGIARTPGFLGAGCWQVPDPVVSHFRACSGGQLVAADAASSRRDALYRLFCRSGHARGGRGPLRLALAAFVPDASSLTGAALPRGLGCGGPRAGASHHSAHARDAHFWAEP